METFCMKRYMTLLLACIVLLTLAACTRPTEEPSVDAVPTETAANTEEPTEVPEPTGAPSELQLAIAGWWQVTEGAAEGKQVLMRFETDGRVYLTPTDYFESLQDPQAYCCYWQEKGGQLFFLDVDAEDSRAPLYCLLLLNEDGTMSILWTSEARARLTKLTDEQAEELYTTMMEEPQE